MMKLKWTVKSFQNKSLSFIPLNLFNSSAQFGLPAKLNYVFYPSKNNDPDQMNLVVLHGLLGSSANFQSIVKSHKISNFGDSFLLDLRNHGASEHRETMDLEEMANDVHHFIEENQLQNNLVLLAHSFGARVAMTFALQYPELLKGLIIVDMAPYNYYNDPRFSFIKITHKLLGDLLSIDLKKDFTEIIESIKTHSPSQDFVGLLVSNVIPDPNGGYRWRINLKTIFENYLKFQQVGPQVGPKGKFKGPVKVICGGMSDYVTQDILPNFCNIFENFEVSRDVTIIDGAGHWLHHQKPHEFINVVGSFLQKLSNL